MDKQLSNREIGNLQFQIQKDQHQNFEICDWNETEISLWQNEWNWAKLDEKTSFTLAYYCKFCQQHQDNAYEFNLLLVSLEYCLKVLKWMYFHSKFVKNK